MDVHTNLAIKIPAFLANPTSAYVEQNPEILGSPAAALLQTLAKGLKNDGHAEKAKLYDECRVLFHLCRKVGAKKAFSLHKGYLTAGSELRGLLNAAEAAVAKAQLESSPAVAEEACAACRNVLEHPRFAQLSRALQLEMLLKSSGAQLIEGQLTGRRESFELAKMTLERALPLAEPGSEMHVHLLSNLAVALETLAATGDPGAA